MNRALQNLLGALDLERRADLLYEGGSPPEMGNHLFGGQVVAQALVAVQREAEGVPVHSLHASFLRRGTPRESIAFEVVPLRNSRSFRAFQVLARQQDEVILQATISCHRPEEGPEHQIPVDEIGEPEGEPYEDGMQRAVEMLMPEGTAPRRLLDLPIEIRGVGGLALFSEEVKPPVARCWMRTRDRLPDDPALHQCLFAYASDYPVMAPALHPHPVPVLAFQSASLDHAIWFHRPFRFDEWTLFEIDSPITHGARGLGRGLLYTRAGELVASCVQEGLLRPRAAR